MWAQSGQTREVTIRRAPERMQKGVGNLSTDTKTAAPGETAVPIKRGSSPQFAETDYRVRFTFTTSCAP